MDLSQPAKVLRSSCLYPCRIRVWTLRSSLLCSCCWTNRRHVADGLIGATCQPDLDSSLSYVNILLALMAFRHCLNNVGKKAATTALARPIWRGLCQVCHCCHSCCSGHHAAAGSTFAWGSWAAWCHLPGNGPSHDCLPMCPGHCTACIRLRHCLRHTQVACPSLPPLIF